MGNGERIVRSGSLGVGRTFKPSGVRQRVAWALVLVLVFQVFAVAGSTSGSMAAVDSTAPELVEFSFTPSTVDASTGNRTVTVTARIADDMAGVGAWLGLENSVWFVSPSTGQTLVAKFSDSDRISGDRFDGVYRATITVPRHAEHGTWQVGNVLLVDQVGNLGALATVVLAEKGFPTSLTQTGTGDTSPPQVTAFTIAPTTVDTSGGDAAITFTARLTDNLSGVGGKVSSVSFASAGTSQSIDVTFTAADRVSGTIYDGVYQTTVTLPRHSGSGLWTVDQFIAYDRAGNRTWLSRPQMTTAGLPTSFTQTGGGDATPPVLRAFIFEPSTTDVTTGYDTVVFTMRITDNRAGVGMPEWPGALMLAGPTLKHSIRVGFSATERVSGDESDGIYEVSVPILQFSETGVWTVEFVGLQDNVGNMAFYSSTDLKAKGFPAEFTTVEPETNPPVLANFSLTPTKVDTSQWPRTITMKARIVDDAAGLGGEPSQSWLTIASRVVFASPSTNESVTAHFSYRYRVLGDALDGVYEVNLTIPKGAELGTWTVQDFTLVDAYGNMGTLTAPDLTEAGFPTTFEVTGPGGPPAPPPPSPPSPPAPGALAPTVGLVDPGAGQWHLRSSVGDVTTFYFGNPGDYPIMGDWDCDGVDTPGLYRQSDGYVYLRNSNTQGIADIRFFFGNPGDVPLAGDFNGNGCDTVSIYRPSLGRFYIINKLGANDGGLGAAETDYLFGNPGDKAFVGDFDGDGVDTVGLHRESTGLVYFRNTHIQGIADSQFIFGNPGDRLVAGDWNSNGTDTPALFRPSNTMMYLRYTNTQGNADAQFSFGSSTWLPVAGVFGFG